MAEIQLGMVIGQKVKREGMRCFNFMCQVDWVKGCPDNKTLFLDVSSRVFLEKIRFESVQRGKKICPHQYGQTLSNPLRVQTEQKGRERVNSLSCFLCLS